MRTMLFSLGLLLAFSANVFSQSAVTPAKEQCSPPLGACNTPVKWVADKENCSCYACEYGKPTQHTGCTSNVDTKAFLRDISEKVWVLSAPMKFTGVWDFSAAKLTDKDGKSWEILNPDALKDQKGSFVQFFGRVPENAQAVLVTKVGG